MDKREEDEHDMKEQEIELKYKQNSEEIDQSNDGRGKRTGGFCRWKSQVDSLRAWEQVKSSKNISDNENVILWTPPLITFAQTDMFMTQAFLGSLQNARTKIWSILSAEDQQRYSNLATRWLDDAPPSNIQARFTGPTLPINTAINRMASSMSGKIIQDFQAQLFKTCGIQCVVLTAYEHENGRTLSISTCITVYRDVFYFNHWLASGWTKVAE
ncbi:hypothetical protein BJY52DRAFT_1230222 [Lactarius psammicola]|nr:hypothetical protein BJY52DRAFT_1230222 [Lactarius psammicola]